ncbi:MAG: hypothetical protein ACTSVE_14580, partial [Candidatus Helarchaeota archaeon]
MSDEEYIKTASKRMEGTLKDRVGTKFSIGYFILILLISLALCVGTFYITTYLIAQILTITYVLFSFVISIIHVSENKFLRPSNRFIRFLLPINEKRIKSGPTMFLRYIYMLSLGVLIAIIAYTFLPWFGPSSTSEFGFYSFIWNSGSLTLLCIFLLIVISPIVFSALFTSASLTYNDETEVRYAKLIPFLPILFFFPSLTILFSKLIDIIIRSMGSGRISMTLPVITPDDLTSFFSFFISFLIFLAAWIITLKIWYGEGTKRSFLVIFSIGIIQAIVSLFIFYHNLLEQIVFGHSISFLGLIHPIHGIWFLI